MGVVDGEDKGKGWWLQDKNKRFDRPGDVLITLMGALSGAALSGPTGWWLQEKSKRFDRPGDVLIGGSFSIFHFDNITLFDFTTPPARLASNSLSRWNYLVAQSFVFAIEEINRDAHLLPNLTLGFSIRNSWDCVHGALHEMMGFLTGQEEPIPNYTCQLSIPRVALVGDTRSVLSVAMARLLGLYKFPQVSYSSTLASLSDKTQFPSFLRTLSSDVMFSHAIAQLVIHFRWSWVNILAQDDDFGQQGSSLVTQELTQAGICIEFHLYVPFRQSLEKINSIVQKMESCTATVVLVFLSNLNFQLVLQGLLGRGVFGKVWASQSTLHTALALTMPGISQVLQSTFSLLQHSIQVPGFPEFLAHLHPTWTPEDPFIERFWESTFGCTWPHRNLESAGNSTVSGKVQFCSGNESLRGQVYPFQEKLLHSLRNVQFKTPDRREIKFDVNGDLVTEFDILYGQKTTEGLFHFFHIGKIHPRASLKDRMTVHLMKEELQYRFKVFQVPSSVCSRSCAPGFSQIPRQGFPHCCFECSSCPEGQFADQKDVKRCLLCPEEQYSSPTRDYCLPRTETFLAFDEPLGLTLASVALTLAIVALLVIGVFLKHRDTPVVRANNRALSYILLASLTLCALCPLLFLGRPTAATCLLRQTTFAVVFTMAISSILAKTLTVVLAFRVTRPGDRVRVCLRPGASTSVVLVASFMQIVLCGVWLGISPPFPDRDMSSKPHHIVIYCQEGSGVAFYCMLSYLGLLAVGTFSVAFLARGLPDAFNETKFLTFSMLLFCCVWTAFLPLYHSARGKSTVAVEIFSILASTAGLLGGIFFPKCYIILLKPERNAPAWLRQRHQTHLERQSKELRSSHVPRAPQTS
ncbi:PREDICTED: extracellular calcium-sensing receptor-like [Galeopterus variegatus]|uniref:Extracellular calcium-sensing receptor-like n=1 Tax=Galeopterus variegatus TaxID=482537 RepID=A0ABM0SG64_GALVR|nr:PREDICTED: extracellular calcium-sensing receptor-like [Galeopterus variegatus]